MAQKNEEAKTMFDKATNLSEGDRFEVFGESLKVGHIRRSAASLTIMVWGSHEDQTQPPRYDLVVDARHETVEFQSVRA
jgi:hypothetical protein